MSKSSTVTATFKPNAEETYQVTVRAASSYPDALDEARTQAVRAVHELIAAARVEYGETADKE